MRPVQVSLAASVCILIAAGQAYAISPAECEPLMRAKKSREAIYAYQGRATITCSEERPLSRTDVFFARDFRVSLARIDFAVVSLNAENSPPAPVPATRKCIYRETTADFWYGKEQPNDRPWMSILPIADAERRSGDVDLFDVRHYGFCGEGDASSDSDLDHVWHAYFESGQEVFAVESKEGIDRVGIWRGPKLPEDPVGTIYVLEIDAERGVVKSREGSFSETAPTSFDELPQKRASSWTTTLEHVAVGSYWMPSKVTYSQKSDVFDDSKWPATTYEFEWDSVNEPIAPEYFERLELLDARGCEITDETKEPDERLEVPPTPQRR